MKKINARWALWTGALLLAGCASTALPQFYSLADTTPPPVQKASGSPTFIEMAPVAMPERLMRPQLVVRRMGAAEGAKVEILELHRWSSSFENELRDALASGVAARLGAVDATKTGVPRGQPAVRIAVQLRQLDAVEGSGVDAGFSWTLRRTDEGAPVVCQLSLTEPAVGGADALAAGVRRVTAVLADAIARSVTALATSAATATSTACPA